MESISVRQARRLALIRSGVLKPELTGMPSRAAGRGKRARSRCHAVIDRFGYLQLDSVAISGARTHSIVLASRLDGFATDLGEDLLARGEPLFEYWGHEACWLPMALYPHFEFRRREYRVHPWWGDILGENAALATHILERIHQEGPLRSMDLDGERTFRVWGGKLATRVAEALWSAGDLAVPSRNRFQRTFDLTERVIPEEVRRVSVSREDALDTLLLRALSGHGWATTGTLAATWRLVNKREPIAKSLHRLEEQGLVQPCKLITKGRDIAGWIRSEDIELALATDKVRPRRDRGVLLSPFDPLLSDRGRTRLLFGFDQVLEIYKPAHERQHGYYCLPVLAGERLIARVDLRAERKSGKLLVLSCHYESEPKSRERNAVEHALLRFAGSVGLAFEG